MEIVSDALEAERSTLFIYDGETHELFSRVAQGEQIGEIRFPASMGIAGSVFGSGVAEIIADAYADPRFNDDVDRKTGYKTRNILCTPIRHNGEPIGVTQVLNKRSGGFDEEDMRLLEALTAQAAAALDNAQLFERVERAHREEAKLLEVTSAIASCTRAAVSAGECATAAGQMTSSWVAANASPSVTRAIFLPSRRTARGPAHPDQDHRAKRCTRDTSTRGAPAASAWANVSTSHATAAAVRRSEASSSAAVRPRKSSRPFQLPTRCSVANTTPCTDHRAFSTNSANSGLVACDSSARGAAPRLSVGLEKNTERKCPNRSSGEKPPTRRSQQSAHSLSPGV